MTVAERSLGDQTLPSGGSSKLPVSLQSVAPRAWAGRVVVMLLVLVVLVASCLIFVPWQQSVTGNGRIIVYSAMERPQNVDAPIPGRLVRWHIQEGQVVRAGETLAEISDLDSKFLDPEQARRLQDQRAALVIRREAAQARAAALESQLQFLDRSRNVAIPTAGERAMQAQERLGAAREALTASKQSYTASREVSLPSAREKALQAEERERAAQETLTAAIQSLKAAEEVGLPTSREKASQAKERERAAEEALIAAQQNLRAAQEVAIPSAREKLQQAVEKKRAAEQAVQAARQVLVASGLNRERIRELFKKTLRSRRDDELAEVDLVRARTDVERAQAALSVAERDVRVAELDQEKAQVDAQRARTEVERAKAAVDIARRDTTVGGFDLTKAQVDIERARTEVERARAALDIARRDVKVARLEANRAELDVVRARTEVERSRAGVDIARRDTSVGDLDRTKVEADTAATLSSVQASLASARETIASITSDILKVEVELQNVRQRMDQRYIRAPRDGRVVRLMRVGAGEAVKSGDTLAVLAPETADQAVELYLSDNDAPLVDVGRPVRLQFAGWPALQFSGWPSVAVGTFAGRVTVIDAIDDGTSRYRVIVKPDEELIRQGKEEPWPNPRQLRPGAEVTGWVMLETVSLGFELWRQFNAFPPTIERDPSDKPDAYGKSTSEGKGDGKGGEIKRKAGK